MVKKTDEKQHACNEDARTNAIQVYMNKARFLPTPSLNI